MNKPAVIIGFSIMLFIGIIAGLFASGILWLNPNGQIRYPGYMGIDQQPAPEQAQPNVAQPNVTQPSVMQYTGILQNGISLFSNGKAIVEFTFQDGRTFTASEQMAAEAHMKIGGTYTVSFSQADPQIALSIQEAQP